MCDSCKEEITQLKKQVAELINKSILHSEYIDNNQNFKEYIDNVAAKLDNLNQGLDTVAKSSENLSKATRKANKALEKMYNIKEQIFAIMSIFFGIFSYISISADFTKGLLFQLNSIDTITIIFGILALELIFFGSIYYFLLRPFLNNRSQCNSKCEKSIGKYIVMTSVAFISIFAICSLMFKHFEHYVKQITQETASVNNSKNQKISSHYTKNIKH